MKPSMEATAALAQAALSWWRGRRRRGWTEAEHLAKPKALIGETFASDDQLALACAEYVRGRYATSSASGPGHAEGASTEPSIPKKDAAAPVQRLVLYRRRAPRAQVEKP